MWIGPRRRTSHFSASGITSLTPRSIGDAQPIPLWTIYEQQGWGEDYQQLSPHFPRITTLFPVRWRFKNPFNTGETSSNYSVNLSLSPHKSSHGTFLDSHSRFIQDPAWMVNQPAVEKETYKTIFN